MKFKSIIQTKAYDCNIKWRMTNLCNYRCSYCIQDADGVLADIREAGKSQPGLAEINAKLLSAADTLNILMEQAPHTSFSLLLVGGEVSVLEIPSILRRLKSKKLKKLHITTNLSASVSYYRAIREALPEDCVFRLECSWHEEYTSAEAFLEKVKAASAFADVSVEAVSTADNGEKIDELIQHLQKTTFPWKIETDKRNKTSMEEKRKKCRSGWGTAPVGGPVRYTVTLEDNSVKTYASANRMVMELSPNGRFLEVEGHICTEGWDNLDIDGDMVFQRSETGECSRKRVPISEFVWRKPLPCSGDQAKHCSLCGNMSLYEIPEH